MQRKFLIIKLVFVIVILSYCGSQILAQGLSPKPEGKNIDPTAVMIVAHKGFRDEELFKPRKILESSGVKVTIASSSLGECKGMLGGTISADIKLEDIKLDDYDAIIFVGGSGARQFWNDPLAHKLAKEAEEKDKLIAAICIAPVTLANAKILEGKKATVWFSEASKLKARGAIYTGRPLQIDGNIITASGPVAAEEFGKAILEALK